MSRAWVPAILLTLGALAAPPAAFAGDDPPASAEAKPPTADDVLRDLSGKETVRRLDAAVAAKSFQDARLVSPLAKLLRDEHPDVRTAAIAALGARLDPDQRKKAADPLGDRLRATDGKVEHEQERLAIARALHDLAQPATIDVLLDGIEIGTGAAEVEARCLAVGNVPSAKAIEGLIAFMSKRHRDGAGQRAAAVRGLQYATGERGSGDPDHWRAWWKEHEKTFDFAAAAARREQERQKKAEKAEKSERKPRKKDGGDSKD